jgi:hypothetical protein
MSTRLRTWAMTGEYSEDVDRAGEPSRRARGGSAWSEHAVTAVLVPVGILIGALLAAAIVARLLALPFVALCRPGGRRAE